MVSTPETVSCETLMGDICAWPCDEEEPLEEEEPLDDWLLAEGWAALEPLCAWANFPLTFMTVMLMLPVTSLTPSSAAICVSLLLEIDCVPGLVCTRERVNFSPCLDWSGGFMPNCCAPP